MSESETPVAGADEKVCPYCAEVIKAAAIKCRYCQSDLPELVVEPGSDDEFTDEDRLASPVGAPGIDDTSDADTSDDPDVPVAPAAPRAADPVVRRLAVLCGVLAVILVSALVVLTVTQRPSDPDTASSGQVTDADFRSAAMSAAAANATTVLSYSYKTLAENQKAARDVLSPKFADEYDAVMTDAGKKATDAKLTQKATVLTSALMSITESKAVALLSVNTVTTAEGSERQQLLQNRVKMTLERKDGDWTVSNMVRF